MATIAQKVEIQLMEIEVMRQAIKQRAMLYQADWKERQAEAEGKPFDFYHHMPYVQWDKIRDSKHQ